MAKPTKFIKQILQNHKNDSEKVRKNPLSNRNTQLLLAIALFFIVMVIYRPDIFLTSTNINSMLVQIADLGIFAMAMAIAMISGGIDLSIVNLANLVAVVNAIMFKAVVTETTSNATIWLLLITSVCIALIIGFIGGLINSFLIANLNIPEILATLATMNLYLGISTIITGGRGIIGFPEQLLYFGSGSLLGIPIPFIIFVFIAAILYIFIHKLLMVQI